MPMRRPLLPAALCLSACAVNPPSEPPPLASMEEPSALLAAPDEEAARAALPAGTFSGVEVEDARDSLEALLGEPQGLVVARVVENSPADAAGLEPGDVLLEAGLGPAPAKKLGYPSDWRALELEAEPGAELAVFFDRAGAGGRATLALEARVHPAGAPPVERFREEERVGVVLRTATEVEARAAGLAPGAGAVVVGLAKESPWRTAGVRFGDLLVAAGGEPVRHPEVVLRAIAAAEEPLLLELVRAGERRSLEAPVSSREQELTRIWVPLLFSYSRERGASSTSFLLGVFSYERTPAAWGMRILWIISFGGGDADRLREVDA